MLRLRKTVHPVLAGALSGALLACALSPAVYARAETVTGMNQVLTRPVEEVLLTVTGKIRHANDGDRAIFDLPMLAAMETERFTTTTIWTDGEHTFAGVPLVRLMAIVGAEGTSIRATAANDYAVDIPAEDWVEGGPILAFLMDGKTMSLRDKGPLWVIYPYDTNPKYQTEVAYSRSIWQLKSMEVE